MSHIIKNGGKISLDRALSIFFPFSEREGVLAKTQPWFEAKSKKRYKKFEYRYKGYKSSIATMSNIKLQFFQNMLSLIA